MRAFVNFFIEDSDFWGKLCFLFVVLFAPVFLAYKAKQELSQPYRNIRRGTLYVGGLIAVVFFAAWFFMIGGIRLWGSLITSLGPWLIGLFVIIIACLVLLPICGIGLQFRRLVLSARNPGAYKLSRSKTFAACAGFFLLCVVTALLVFFASGKAAFDFALVWLISVGVGWFGYIFVPDL